MPHTAALKFLLANENTWLALLRIVKLEDAGPLGAALARCFAAVGKDFDLVRLCIDGEVVDTEHETLLFRSSGIRSSIVAQSGLIHGRGYLQAVIAPVLHDHVHKASRSLELDPLRLQNSTKDLQKNAESLVNVCNHLLAALLSAADAMPVTLRKTYEYARRAAATKFPEQSKRIAASLFFLRLLCPVLVSPEAYGLVKERLPDEAQRTHVLLAKLMQSVANEQPPFEKEPYMQLLNSWVQGAIPSIRRFFKIALRVVQEDNLEAPLSDSKRKLYAVENHTSINDSKLIYNFIRKNKLAFREQLIALNATQALSELPTIWTHGSSDLALSRTPSDATDGSDNSPRSAESDAVTRSSSTDLVQSRSSPAISTNLDNIMDLMPSRSADNSRRERKSGTGSAILRV